MGHYIFSKSLLVLLVLNITPSAEAQWPRPYPDRGGWGADLTGTYVNTSNGRTCEIYREGREYVFVNENGTPARFAYVGPRQLQMVAGDWNPYITVTVNQDRDGRPLLRFKEPGQAPGFWTMGQ
jgi:hypothetical protein